MTACQEADQGATLDLKTPQIHCRLLAKLQPIHSSIVMIAVRNLCHIFAMTDYLLLQAVKCASSQTTHPRHEYK